MANRLVNIVACVVVGLIVVAGAVIYWQQSRQPPGDYSEVPVVAQPPPSPAKAKQTDPPAETPPEVPRRLFKSWQEVEARLDELRQERKQRPAALFDLERLYDDLYSPQFFPVADYPEHCAKLAEWRREIPDSPSPLIALAGAHIRWAWQARGSGFAYTVTKEGWEDFHARIAEARRLLEKALEMNPHDGEAVAELITVAKAEGLPLEQTRAWLDQGIKLDPTYGEMYRCMGEYLLPRWHGEPGDIERFAKEMTERLSGDDGLDAFGQIAFQVNNYDGWDERLLFFGQYDRELLGKSAQVLARRYPDLKRLQNFAALCAQANGSHAAARQLGPLIGDYSAKQNIWPSQWSQQAFLSWAAATTDPAGEERRFWATPFSPNMLEFTPDSRFVWSVVSDGRHPALLFDVESGQGRPAMSLLTGGRVHNLALDHDRQWAVASVQDSGGEQLALWNLSRPGIPALIPIPERCVATSIHPSKMQVAWAGGQSVRVLDIETSVTEPTLEIGDAVREVNYSRDGKLLAIRHGPISLWDVGASQRLFTLPHQSQNPPPPVSFNRLLRFDEQGRLWGVGSTGAARDRRICLLRSAPNGQAEIVIPDLGGRVEELSACMSADCGLLAIGAIPANSNLPGAIYLWDVAAGKRLKNLPGHWCQTALFDFSPDNKRLASMGIHGGEIKIWSLADIRP